MAAVAVFVALVLAGAQAIGAPREDWLEIAPDLAQPPKGEATLVEVPGERLAAWREHGFGRGQIAIQTRIAIPARGRARLRQLSTEIFLTNSGAQAGATTEFSVRVSTSRAHLLRAYTRLPEGRRVGVDPESIQITDPIAPNLFSDVKVVSIPFPSVVPGAVTVLEWELVDAVDDWVLPWSRLFYLKTATPILSQAIEVVNERGAGWLQWATNDDALECEELGEPRGSRLRCTRGEADALATDATVRSYFDLLPHFVVAERMDWPEFSARVDALIEPQLGLSEDLEALVEKIRGEHEGDTERARALHEIVANRVRYLGFEHGESAIVPRPAALTWERRFGDCKDKVTLFVALARALGIEATPVLTSADSFEPKNFLIPAASYFDHMIVCTPALPDDEGCIDPTLAEAPPELPFVLQGGARLDIARRDDVTIRELPDRRIKWEVTVERDVAVGCDGAMKETVVRRFGGSWGNSLRSGLVGLSPSERNQYFVSEYANVTTDIARPELSVQGLSSVGVPFSVSYAGPIPRRLSLGQDQHFYDIDVWFRSYSVAMLAENRFHDYHFAGTKIQSRITYAFCDAITVDTLGAEIDLESRWGTIRRHYTRVPGGVRVETTAELPTARIPLAELDDFRLFLTRSLETSAIQLHYSTESGG